METHVYVWTHNDILLNTITMGDYTHTNAYIHIYTVINDVAHTHNTHRDGLEWSSKVVV